LLEDDPSKLTIYTDAHTSGMIPRWRDMAAIISTKIALIEVPPPEKLAAVVPVWSVVDWVKISAGTLTNRLIDLVTDADAWVAIERRWSDGDYSVRTQVYRRDCRSHDGSSPLLWINMLMTSTATAKEQELQGTSGGGGVTFDWTKRQMADQGESGET
jgi:hypothetical protein